MNIKHHLVLAALLLAAPLVKAQTSVGQPAPLYVQVDSDHPGALDRLENTNGQQEFANDSLRSAASSMAAAAGWTSPITVLHRNEKAPNGAAVLRLLLPEGTAEYVAPTGGKPLFLGRVGDLSVRANYPDPYVYRHRVDTANLEDRPVIREQIELEKDLYASLQQLKRRLGQDHVSESTKLPPNGS